MSIDVRRWHREGLLRVGQRSPYALAGEPTEGIGVLTEADAGFDRAGGETATANSLPSACRLLGRRAPFGGGRPWFRCDAYSRGLCCGRRVALLHSPGGPFACRHCYGSAYESQQEPVRYRGVAKARKIRMRLGGGENITAAFPPEPNGMRWRRYDRLRHAHDQAYARSLGGLAKSGERLERWLKAEFGVEVRR